MSKQKIAMTKYKQYLDDYPPEQYINHLKSIDVEPINEDINQHFAHDKRSEFYKGMIAGIITYFQVLNSASGGEMEDGILHISLDIQRIIAKNL